LSLSQRAKKKKKKKKKRKKKKTKKKQQKKNKKKKRKKIAEQDNILMKTGYKREDINDQTKKNKTIPELTVKLQSVNDFLPGSRVLYFN